MILIENSSKRQGKTIMQEVQDQMAKDSQEIRQRIADYETFIWYCTTFKGRDIITADYCWRHRHD